MENFVPFFKLLKKKQREINLGKRNTWGSRNPATQKPDNSRAYKRHKTKKETREDG